MHLLLFSRSDPLLVYYIAAKGAALATGLFLKTVQGSGYYQ